MKKFYLKQANKFHGFLILKLISDRPIWRGRIDSKMLIFGFWSKTNVPNFEVLSSKIKVPSLVFLIKAWNLETEISDNLTSESCPRP